MVDSKRIPAGELTAYERWELPNIDGGSPSHPSRASLAKQAVKPLTADDIEKIRQEAYSAGFEQGKSEGFVKGKQEGVEAGKKEGYPEGVAQGKHDAKVQMDTIAGNLSRLMAQLDDPILDQQNIVQQAMVNVSMAIARAVIHRELHEDSSSITSAVQAILKDMPSPAKGLKIVVNPVDEPHVRSAISTIESEISVSSDPAMHVGGCVVETSTQLLDYTIEKRFQKTVQSMLMAASQQGHVDNSVDMSTSINEVSEYPSATLDEPIEPANPPLSTGQQQAGQEESAPPTLQVDQGEQVITPEPDQPEDPAG